MYHVQIVDSTVGSSSHTNLHVRDSVMCTSKPLRLSTYLPYVLMFALHVGFLSCVYLLLVCYAHDFPCIFALVDQTFDVSCADRFCSAIDSSSVDHGII